MPELNFKRAHYDCPDQLDDPDSWNGTGVKDFPIPDTNIFLEQQTLDQQDEPVITAIVPMPYVSDDLLEVKPIQSVPTSLVSLFCTETQDWVHKNILDGVGSIIEVISYHDSVRGLLSNRAQVFQSLTVLHSIIDIRCLSIEFFWYVYKIITNS